MPLESTPAAPDTFKPLPGGRIRVLLVDDHPAVRAGARKLIDDEPDMAVVAEARDAEEAPRQSASSIDVAVVDYHLGDGRDGLWLTTELKRLERPPGVLVYSSFADNALAVMAVIAGADGLLDKRVLGQELLSAIRTLARGGRRLPAITAPLAGALRSRLGPRDQAIFGMLLHGIRPDVIKDRLGLTGDELNARRSIILGSLASGRRDLTVPARTDGPLDYERPRRVGRPWAA
jgi:DNA-binding NarL/FixJ family response regulator